VPLFNYTYVLLITNLVTWNSCINKNQHSLYCKGFILSKIPFSLSFGTRKNQNVTEVTRRMLLLWRHID